ncbi:hypothetical protein TWF506_004334 [Arthrobotrys conoides]|uniref:Clr5 domain-containing protein n=1 Tax=Arthrobotrys conoides TaxID=74498 RepID=A0AAN8MWT9_9PEZI
MLDGDEVKTEMRQLYQVLGWTPKEIAAEINKNHNLTVTEPQVRDKLNKLGYKKRICPDQTKAIYRAIVRRKAMGKESAVIIGGIITLSGKKLQRSIRRNLTATEEYQISKGIEFHSSFAELPENLQVCTPRAHDLDLIPLMPRVVRHIPLLVLRSLPIWQFSGLIEEFTLRPSKNAYNDGNLKVTAHGLIPHSPLLRLIIYRISNNLISTGLSRAGDDELMKLLDRINDLGLREPFKRLLSSTSPSIVAVSEVIAPWLYFRQDLELLTFICEIHTKIRVRPFQVLLQFWSYGGVLEPGIKWVEMALRDIEKTNDYPKSEDELGLLLIACKRVRGDISLFQRLWNPEVFPEFVEWPKFYPTSFHDKGFPRCTEDKNIPLWTEDENQLRSLLKMGFTKLRWALTLRAVLSDNHNITKVFLEHLGLISDGEMGLSTRMDLRSHVWEMLEIPVFHEIVARFVTTDIIPYLTRTSSAFTNPEPSDVESALTYNINRVLVWAACLNPEMTEYIIQVMKWANASLTESEVVTLAVELLPCWPRVPRTHEYWEEYHVHIILNLHGNFNPLLAFQKLFRAGIDLTQTELWQSLIWKLMLDCLSLDCFFDDPLEYLKIFLRDPNTINCNLKSSLLTCNIGSGACDIECWLIYSSESIKSSITVKPLFLALFLHCPEALLLLLKSGASTANFNFPSERNPRINIIMNSKFLQACHDRDFGRICDLWDQRIEITGVSTTNLSVRDQIEICLENGELEAAASLLSHLKDSFSRLEVFLAVVKWTNRSTSYTSPAILAVLRPLLKMGILTSPEDINSYISKVPFSMFPIHYQHHMIKAIYKGNLELVDILLEFEQQLNVPEYSNSILLPQNWHEIRIGYTFWAACHSLRCLRCLIKCGFDINGSRVAPNPEDFLSRFFPRPGERLTALSGALKSGDMDTIVFVLQSGADIYTPCGDYQSGIEYAICEGRIDAIALMLAMDHNCHQLALQAAKKTERGYIADYVRNWKPGSNSALFNQGGSAKDISERLPVAFPIELS